MEPTTTASLLSLQLVPGRTVVPAQVREERPLQRDTTARESAAVTPVTHQVWSMTIFFLPNIPLQCTGAVTGVGFKLIALVLCSQSEFET